MTKTAKGWREHRRRAATHFEKRWKERIDASPPDISVLRGLFKKVMSGDESSVLKLLRYQYSSTIWGAKVGDKDVRICYSHDLQTPISIWIASEYEGSRERTD